MSDDFSKLKLRLKDFSDKRDWDQFHTVKNLTMALSIEASELSELMLWKSDDEICKRLKDDRFRKSVEDECADVLNYLTLISSKVGFDLVDVALRKIDENSQKYPADKAFGNAKKYNEL